MVVLFKLWIRSAVKRRIWRKKSKFLFCPKKNQSIHSFLIIQQKFIEDIPSHLHFCSDLQLLVGPTEKKFVIFHFECYSNGWYEQQVVLNICLCFVFVRLDLCTMIRMICARLLFVCLDKGVWTGCKIKISTIKGRENRSQKMKKKKLIKPKKRANEMKTKKKNRKI